MNPIMQNNFFLTPWRVSRNRLDLFLCNIWAAPDPIQETANLHGIFGGPFLNQLIDSSTSVNFKLP